LSESKERIVSRDSGNNPDLLNGYISVFMAAALFGPAFTIAKQPLANIYPLLLSSLVYIISGLSLTPVAKASFFSVHFIKRKDLFYLLLVTILGVVVAPLLLFYGFKQTTASDGDPF
jgi:drug/metabolite transporter (DMT)-like permease